MGKKERPSKGPIGPSIDGVIASVSRRSWTRITPLV